MRTTDAQRPSGRRTAFEYVQEELRHRILSGDLRGGTHLTQAEIAQDLGVSTTPVREAFRQLASEGLVSVDKHRGAVVRKPHLDDAEEIFAMRRLLEPYGATLAIRRMTADEISNLGELHSAMVAADSVSEWFSLNRAFHSGLIEGAKSPRLCATLHGLIDSTGIYLGLALQTVARPFQTGNEDHGSILAAIEQRDEEALSGAVLTHLEHAVLLVREALKEQRIDQEPGSR